MPRPQQRLGRRFLRRHPRRDHLVRLVGDRARRQGRHATVRRHLRPRDEHAQRTAQAGHLTQPQRPAQQARHLPGLGRLPARDRRRPRLSRPLHAVAGAALRRLGVDRPRAGPEHRLGVERRPDGPAGAPDLPGLRLRQPRYAAPGHPSVAARRGPVPRRQGLRRAGPPVVRVRRRLGRADGDRRRLLPRVRRVLPQARARRPRPPLPLGQLAGRARAQAGEGARGRALGARTRAAPPGQVPQPQSLLSRPTAARRGASPPTRTWTRPARPGAVRRRMAASPRARGPRARPPSRPPRRGAGCARFPRATSSRG